MEPVGSSKGRRTAPATLWRDDSCRGGKRQGSQLVLGGLHCSCPFLLHGLHQNCKACPKCALCPSCCAGLLASRCSSAASLNRSSTCLHTACQKPSRGQGERQSSDQGTKELTFPRFTDVFLGFVLCHIYSHEILFLCCKLLQIRF